MPRFTVNAQRFDPYKDFRFQVVIDGETVAGLSKVTALTRTTSVIEFREGGDPATPRKMPGQTTFAPITLERGVTHDTAFLRWANKVWNFGAGPGAESSLADFRKDIILSFFNEAGQLALSYKIYRAWVSEFRALPDLSASSSATAIQSIKIENEGWEIDEAVPEPREPSFEEPGGVTGLADGVLLDVWEQVEAAPVPLRPAVMLEGLRAGLGEAGDAADGLPVGRRDRALIGLRMRLFGARMRCASSCPDCAERVELELDLARMQAAAPPADVALVRTPEGGWHLRPPTTRDLERVLADPASRRVEALVRRCALDPLPDPLPPALVEAASAALHAADPDAEIELSVTCPACGAAWEVPFDITACLWEDVARAARRLLHEVHHLATAYGWSEAEVLAVPPRRRREYLVIGGA